MPVVARQAVVLEPFKAGVREVELPDPAPNQILVAAEYSGVSAGTELAVYTGTHQWLKDPKMTEWKFPFRSGYSAAGKVLAVGAEFPGGFKAGDRVCFPGNHASAVAAWERMQEEARRVGWVDQLDDRSEPDHVEALIALGRLDGARMVLERLEWRGRTLPRTWIDAGMPRARA